MTDQEYIRMRLEEGMVEPRRRPSRIGTPRWRRLLALFRGATPAHQR